MHTISRIGKKPTIVLYAHRQTNYSILRVNSGDPGHSDAFPACELGWRQLGGGAGVPAYSRASFTIRCRRYAGFQPCAAYRLHAGREAPDLLGQVWCLLAAFLLVVVLQGSEPEVEGREAAGISIFNKTWVCLAARNQFRGEVRPSSPCRRGGGRERGWTGAAVDAGWCWVLE